MTNSVKEEIWTTADGRQLRVADMTEEHAKNALRMMIRRGRLAGSLVDAVVARVRQEGIREAEAEAAQLDALEQEFWEDEYRYGFGS